MRDLVTGETTVETTDAVFVLIGALPRTDWLPDMVLRDHWGYVLTGDDVISEGGRRVWSHNGAPTPARDLGARASSRWATCAAGP